MITAFVAVQTLGWKFGERRSLKVKLHRRDGTTLKTHCLITEVPDLSILCLAIWAMQGEETRMGELPGQM